MRHYRDLNTTCRDLSVIQFCCLTLTSGRFVEAMWYQEENRIFWVRHQLIGSDWQFDWSTFCWWKEGSLEQKLRPQQQPHEPFGIANSQATNDCGWSVDSPTDSPIDIWVQHFPEQLCFQRTIQATNLTNAVSSEANVVSNPGRRDRSFAEASGWWPWSPIAYSGGERWEIIKHPWVGWSHTILND